MFKQSSQLLCTAKQSAHLWAGGYVTCVACMDASMHAGALLHLDALHLTMRQLEQV